mgnify:FL=1
MSFFGWHLSSIYEAAAALFNERTNERTYCIYWSMSYGTLLSFGQGGGLFGLKERGFALGVVGGG